MEDHVHHYFPPHLLRSIRQVEREPTKNQDGHRHHHHYNGHPRPHHPRDLPRQSGISDFICFRQGN